MATTSDFGELVELPSNERLWYRDEDHSYWRVNEAGARGKRLPSVSTIVSPYQGGPDGLMNWASELTLDAVASVFKHEIIPDTGAALLERLTEQETTWKDLREQASARGNVAHQWLEALCGLRDFPSLDDASDPEYAMVAALQRWWAACEPEILQSEQIVYSAKHEYAGRFDLRFRHGGHVVLLDLKTSKWIGPNYLVQLAGYDLAAHESLIGRSDEKIILQLRADESWREIKSPATDEDFLDGLRIYRRAQELSKAAR